MHKLKTKWPPEDQRADDMFFRWPFIARQCICASIKIGVRICFRHHSTQSFHTPWCSVKL